MARGNARQLIFEKRNEWQGFLDILNEIQKSHYFRLFAYCLMGNHFHILIQVENIPLSRIMHRLLTTYSLRFNISRERVGHVFQGRYKPKLVLDNIYLIHLLRYIHLNPVHEQFVRLPEDWIWSGHREILGHSERSLVDVESVLGLFDPDPAKALAEYKQYVLSGIDDTSAMEEELPEHESVQIRPKPRKEPLSSSTDLMEILAGVAFGTGIHTDAILGQGRNRRISAARRLFIEKAFSEGYRLNTVAGFLSISGSAVSRTLSKVK